MINRKRLGAKVPRVGAPNLGAGLWLTRDPSTAESAS